MAGNQAKKPESKKTGRNDDRKNGKRWKQGLPPEQREQKLKLKQEARAADPEQAAKAERRALSKLADKENKRRLWELTRRVSALDS